MDLFNEYEAENENGQKLREEVDEILDPIIQKYVSQGFKVNEVEFIVSRTVSLICSEIKLTKAVKQMKEKRSRNA